MARIWISRLVLVTKTSYKRIQVKWIIKYYKFSIRFFFLYSSLHSTSIFENISIRKDENLSTWLNVMFRKYYAYVINLFNNKLGVVIEVIGLAQRILPRTSEARNSGRPIVSVTRLRFYMCNFEVKKKRKFDWKF